MSSYNTRLAGLDAMVLHFSNSSSLDQSESTVLDGIPYVTISRTTKNSRSTRLTRTPLGDRTPDFNITPSSTSCKYALSSTPKQSTHSRPKPCPASTSFHPLPPVPPSSSLQLPSFSNYNFYASTSPPNTQPSAPLSPVLPLRHTDINLLFASPLDIDEHEYHIPAFQHPNSPYVPWALPLRREILCPPTPDSPSSFIPSEYSRSYSRSGARAPEPVEPISHEACTQASNGRRSVGQALKKVKHIAKRLANPFKAVASHMSASGSRQRDRRVLRKQISPLQTDQPSAIRSPSVMSFDSSETTTLATWLAARRRMSLERDCDPQSTMSLEEYERMGSRTSIGRGIARSCGVAGTKAMSTGRVSQQTMGFPQSCSATAGLSREMSMPGGWVFGT